MISTLPSSAKILLVDDNPTNLRVLSSAIQDQEDWTILVATDGESAIEQARYALPDLILLDVMMPGIDGFETCQRLKNSEETRNVPIIFMTALTDPSHKLHGLELGAVDYITKPFHQEEVIARIRLHLKLSFLTQRLETHNADLRKQIAEKERAESRLQQLTHELEDRVEQRTFELSESLATLQKLQVQLIQQEKMSTLGNLVSGIAHEINNPISFLQGNLQPAQIYVQQLMDILRLYRKTFTNPGAEIETAIQSIDLDFIGDDLLKLLSSMDIGIERIYNISLSLRTFSRADRERKVLFDLREGLDSTLLLLKHRLKGNSDRPTIEVIRQYDDIPELKCFAGQINQVFMNILANAIDALDEASIGQSFEALEQTPNRITIRIMSTVSAIKILIQDNGIGMKPAIERQVFDYLFTTKAVGRGTGLGLAIARHVIVEHHQGSIECDSSLGKGTVFTISLPLQDANGDTSDRTSFN